MLGFGSGFFWAGYTLNRASVTETSPYVLIGVALWIAVLKSGVHATLAGVALAFFIPMRNPRQPEHLPLRELERKLHTAVAFGILPIFSFINSGISLASVGLDTLLHPVPLGILAGLFIGSFLSGISGYLFLKKALA